MDRRHFLTSLLAAGAVAAAPKFIFDMGANLWKNSDRTLYKSYDPNWIYGINPAYVNAHFQEIILTYNPSIREFVHRYADCKNPVYPVKNIVYPRHFDINLKEIPPFIKL